MHNSIYACIVKIYLFKRPIQRCFYEFNGNPVQSSPIRHVVVTMVVMNAIWYVRTVP